MKVIATDQTSKNGKDYVSFSYAKPEDSEIHVTKLPTTLFDASEVVTVTGDLEATEVKGDVKEEELPDFEV